MEKDAKKIHNFSVINPGPRQAVTHIFAVDNKEDLQKWMEAFWQHFFDLSKSMFGFFHDILFSIRDLTDLNIKLKSYHFYKEYFML